MVYRASEQGRVSGNSSSPSHNPAATSRKTCLMLLLAADS
ncbi:hypothetical protein HMPREF9530_02830 [Escherichia coli MS 21-1]|nr:hypothetical protein HMPREF9530_02830 [Escherichia coli MS 21-1]